MGVTELQCKLYVISVAVEAGTMLLDEVTTVHGEEEGGRH